MIRGFFFSTTGATTIVQLPLAFVRSGWVNVGTEYEGVVRVIGYHGYGWARTAESSTYAYRLNANPTYIGPLDYVDRWYGFSLRCHWPESKNKSLMLAKNFNFMLV